MSHSCFLLVTSTRTAVFQAGHNRPSGVPPAYGGTRGGDDLQVVVILLAVDVAHVADEWVGGTGGWPSVLRVLNLFLSCQSLFKSIL